MPWHERRSGSWSNDPQAASGETAWPGAPRSAREHPFPQPSTRVGRSGIAGMNMARGCPHVATTTGLAPGGRRLKHEEAPRRRAWTAASCLAYTQRARPIGSATMRIPCVTTDSAAEHFRVSRTTFENIAHRLHPHRVCLRNEPALTAPGPWDAAITPRGHAHGRLGGHHRIPEPEPIRSRDRWHILIEIILLNYY